MVLLDGLPPALDSIINKVKFKLTNTVRFEDAAN